jgi:hypothetical protein
MFNVVHRAWIAWKRFGKKVGDFQARLLLTAFYFIFFSPFALAVRWWSDPLVIKSRAAPSWRPRTDSDLSPMKRATKQF